MKAFPLLLAIGGCAAAFFYVRDGRGKSHAPAAPMMAAEADGAPTAAQAPVPSPQVATREATAAPQGAGPILTFGGTITQHVKGGMFVHCNDFIRALPRGYTLDDIRGDFLLIGYPREGELPDGYHISFDGQQAGVTKYPTIYGSLRTMMQVVYVAPEQRAAAVAAGQSKFGRTALDRPARR